jgi:hypothetical protein
MKSLFEQEAERMAQLNKLDKQKESPSFIGSIVGFIGGFLFIVVAFAYGVFVHGFVGHKLWAWFVVPVFHLEPISILQAAGLSFLCRLFTYENPFALSSSMKGKDTSEIATQAITILLLPWISLLVGYIVHCLM